MFGFEQQYTIAALDFDFHFFTWYNSSSAGQTFAMLYDACRFITVNKKNPPL
jgi:hypothetical protein